MSNRQHIAPSQAAEFLLELGVVAIEIGLDDWQAGGALPDVLKDLKREGHISDSLYVAGCRLAHDMTRCHGRSGGLVSRYCDQVDGGVSEGLPPQHATDFDAFQRMDSVLGHLRGHEREILAFCVLSRELQRGSLSDWGRQRSKYQSAKTAKAFATGQIRSMLQSLEELYRDRVPRTVS